MIARTCYRMMAVLIGCLPLVVSAQNQDVGRNVAPVVNLLLSGEKPLIFIPNQGSQTGGADIVVPENSSQQGTFEIDFNALAASLSALRIVNRESSTVINISAAELDGLSNNNIIVQGLSGGALRLIDSASNGASTTVIYEYDLTELAFDHLAGPNTVIDRFELAARNRDGESSDPVSLNILIADVGLSPAPAGSAGLISGILDAGTGTPLSDVLTGTGKDAISLSGVSTGAINLVSDESHQSIASIMTSSDLTNLDVIGENLNPPKGFSCVNCFRQPIQLGSTLILDKLTQVWPTYTVHFGRRSDIIVTFAQGIDNEQYNAADLLYAYSPDTTLDVSALAQGANTIAYSKQVGTNPVDQGGFSGVLGAVNLDINFGSQQITSLTMNLTTADGDWNVHLPYVIDTTTQNAVALTGSHNSFRIEGLASDPTGGITAAGTSTRYDVYGDVQIALLGDGAEGVMLTYNLSVIDTLGAPRDAETIGSVLLNKAP